MCLSALLSRLVDAVTSKYCLANDNSQIFLACSSVDLLALMDQTTLAASLSIIGNALGASDQTSWISGGYFV
jgi:hypothetical protein